MKKLFLLFVLSIIYTVCINAQTNDQSGYTEETKIERENEKKRIMLEKDLAKREKDLEKQEKLQERERKKREKERVKLAKKKKKLQEGRKRNHKLWK